MHKDSRGRDIDQADFYLCTISGRVLYFTGKYERNNPVFKKSSGLESQHTESLTSAYVKISNPQSFISQLIEDLTWMKEKLSQLEECTQSQPKLTGIIKEDLDWLRNQEISPTFLEKYSSPSLKGHRIVEK